jgi:diguanylate cyclase (GGDEF)-like protein
VEQRPGDPDGRDARRGPRRRTSLLPSLVLLALLPSIGLAAVSAYVVTGHVRDARAAGRIAEAAEAHPTLHRLRLAVESEAASAAAGDTDPATRAATDEATAAARRAGTPVTGGEIEGVAGDLQTLRIDVDADPASSSATDVTRYREIAERAARLERTSAAAIAGGGYGAGRPGAQRAASELDDVARVVALGGRRAAAFSLLTAAPGAATPDLMAELRTADAAYRDAAAELPALLSSELRTAWQVFATSQPAVSFDQAVGEVLAGLPTAVAAQPAGAFATGLTDVLGDAAGGVTSAADADRSAAVLRAAVTAALAALLLALTVAALVAAVRAVRRRPAAAAGDVPERLDAAADADVQRTTTGAEQPRQEPDRRATHDALTGVVSRAEGERLLAEAIERSRGEDTRVGLLVVDLEHLQHVNDAYGHSAGDHALQVTAARLEARLRGRDIVCRFSGDQFVVLLDPVASEFAAIDIGERLIAAVAEPIRYDDHEIFVAASVGVATARAGELDAEALLGRAERALHRVKASGRGGVVTH